MTAIHGYQAIETHADPTEDAPGVPTRDRMTQGPPPGGQKGSGDGLPLKGRNGLAIDHELDASTPLDIAGQSSRFPLQRFLLGAMRLYPRAREVTVRHLYFRLCQIAHPVAHDGNSPTYGSLLHNMRSPKGNRRREPAMESSVALSRDPLDLGAVLSLEPHLCQSAPCCPMIYPMDLRRQIDERSHERHLDADRLS